MIPALRRRRLRTRIALLAVLLLLWSQTALAWHAACLAPVAHAADTAAPMTMAPMADHGSACHEQAPPAPEMPLCASHCDQGVPSPDTARIPALPALPALVPAPMLSLRVDPVIQMQRLDLPPPVPWHRPTPHPAALLLI